MKSFSKTIGGIKFKFIPQRLGNSEEWMYHVESEDHTFLMRIDKNGNWKISSKVSFIIKEIEDQLAAAIDSKSE